MASEPAPVPPRPRLADADARARNLARARRMAIPDFGRDILRAEIEERLNEVNRSFTRPVLVATDAASWSGVFSGWPVVEAGELLDLEPGAHDLVVHAMALHWAEDPVGQIVQCRRALAPDGLFLGAFPGGRTLAGLRAALMQAEVELRGGAAPRVIPMIDLRDAGAFLQRAGLALPVADSIVTRVSYASIVALARDLRAAGEGNALAARHRAPLPRAVARRAETLLRASEPETGDRFVERLELVFLTGWAPADNQPKPLRPGSAQARLADALGTVEYREDGLGTDTTGRLDPDAP